MMGMASNQSLLAFLSLGHECSFVEFVVLVAASGTTFSPCRFKFVAYKQTVRCCSFDQEDQNAYTYHISLIAFKPKESLSMLPRSCGKLLDLV